MALSIGAISPFSVSLPTAGGGSGGPNGSQPAPNGTAAPADLIDVRLPPPPGAFTAVAGDAFSLRQLVDTGGRAFDAVARYRVALRDDPSTVGGGRLTLRGADVTDQRDFTAAEFNELQFVAGADGSRTDLLVVARQGTANGSGGLSGIVDSVPVQLAAAVTGRRSLDAAAALRTAASTNDTDFLAVAQDAAIFDGLGGKRPSVETVGNFTAAAGDAFSLRELFDAGAGAFDSVARYRVALRDDPATPGGGRLFLNGVDVTSQRDFTPTQFNELQFVAGADGAATDLLVVARQGKSDGAGGLTGIIDSKPVQITATTTGTRSVNAGAALRTTATGADADFLRLVQDADIFDGLGGKRPTLTTVGNVGVAAGDTLSLRELFDAGADAFDSVARYRVALRDDPATAGGGRLLLNGVDVTGQRDFTPAEFNQLQFSAGAAGAATELLVVARQGKADGVGGLTGIIDSAPVPITITAGGTRSLNAAAALRTTTTGDEATFLGLARDAAVFDGLGKDRPKLGTVGSFSGVAGDALSLRELFDAGADAFGSVARFRVALRDDPATAGGAQLLLNGVDVSDRTDFTPTEFNELQFVLGAAGAATDLVVVARAGKPDGAGGLTAIIDSPAVQLTATASGTRSLNALAALRTTPASDDAERVRLAQDADVFDGLGGKRPTLTTVGNFTAAAADAFSLRQLFDAGANAFDTVARYRVALSAATGAGTLLLDGADVSAQRDFTAAEFNQLQFVAGSDGSSARLTVVARTGKDDGSGGLTGIVDSPAIEITARVTGQRSLNAAPALRTPVLTDDADFLQLAQDAAVYDGLGGTRPGLGSALGAGDPISTLTALAAAAGNFRSFGGTNPSAATASIEGLAALYGQAVGSRDLAGVEPPELQALRQLAALLDADAVGGFAQAGGSRTALAIAAYGRTAAR